MAKNALMFVYWLLLLISVGVDAVRKCYDTRYFTVNSTYDMNRRQILSSLAPSVPANGGFYNTSIGRGSDRVYALALCREGYDTEACIRCVNDQSKSLIEHCPNQTEAFIWDGDNEASCLVRYTNRPVFGRLELQPVASASASDDMISNLTQFYQKWEGLMRRTIAAASVDNFSRLKYYAVLIEQLTDFQDMYVLMQCTPDISSDACSSCLRECVNYYQRLYRAKRGGDVARSSCFFRWDLSPFYGAFDNIKSSRSPPETPPQPPPSNQRTNNSTNIKRGGNSTLITVIVGVTTVAILCFAGLIYAFCRMRKSTRQLDQQVDWQVEMTATSDGRRVFDLGTIKTATSDFSFKNKLGQGGFGLVYKGMLPNGQEIAVKKLSKDGQQGEKEFKNEVRILARLQHRNLVKLLGYCLEGEERLLIYEFVCNSSLDRILFDEDKRSELSWNKRYRIIEGIVRGILYLHEDSRSKIIHLDLKASNILLDAKLEPKVSDFGLARLFSTDESQRVTSRIVGTEGYMAPEYRLQGEFSTKSDVYSFGVLLLELLSGQKSKHFGMLGLPSHAWKFWNEGRVLNIIDPVITNDCTLEIEKCIKIGLLCVQENVARRPTMKSIFQWLGTSSISLPEPGPPPFTRSSTLSLQHSPEAPNGEEAARCSTNDVTITQLEPR